jgi:hypothetical protein
MALSASDIINNLSQVFLKFEMEAKWTSSKWEISISIY